MKRIIANVLGFLLSAVLFFTSVYAAIGLVERDYTVIPAGPAVVQNNNITDQELSELWAKTQRSVQDISLSGADLDSRKQLRSILDILIAKTTAGKQKTSYHCLVGFINTLLSYEKTGGDQKALGKFLQSADGQKLFSYATLSKSDLFLCVSALYERARNDKNTAVLSLCGDTAFGTYPDSKKTNQFPYVFQNVAKGDFNYFLKNCYPFFKTDDLTVMNNETSVSKNGKLIDKLWPINSDPKFLKIYNLASVEAVNLANNHTKDCSTVGYADTLKSLQGAGIRYFDKGKPYSVSIDGINLVFLGYDARTSLSGEALKNTIINDIKRVKTKNNLVFVELHWGKEYVEQPLSYQKNYAYTFLDAGADFIIGGHPHIMEGIEQYKGKYILYSISDFLFGSDPDLLSRMTAIFRIRIDKNTKKIALEIVPTYENSDGRATGYNNFQPLPVYGKDAEPILSYLLRVSKPLKYGVTKYSVFNPF